MQDLALYTNILAEYDDILIGKKKSFSSIVFYKGNHLNERNALIIVQYAFTRYMKWTADMMAENINETVIHKLHLDMVINYIKFPVEYDSKSDYSYLVSLIFPQYHLNMYDKTIHTYERVLNKQINKFPKSYFLGSDGLVRAGICLQYMINHFVFFTSINELYHIFGTDIGYGYLKDYKLLSACKDAFETPVDYLHFSLSDEQKSEFFYRFYKFKYMTELIDKHGRKQHTNIRFLLKTDNSSNVSVAKEYGVQSDPDVSNDDPEQQSKFAAERLTVDDLTTLCEKKTEEQKEKNQQARNEIVDKYDLILSRKNGKFSKNYFENADGQTKARVCMQRMINRFIDYTGINDLYSIFASNKIIKLLKRYRLMDAYKKFYDTPVDFLYDAIPEVQDNLFLFWYYKFTFSILNPLYTFEGRVSDIKLNIPEIDFKQQLNE